MNLNSTKLNWLHWKFIPKLFFIIFFLILIDLNMTSAVKYLTLDPIDDLTNQKIPDITHSMAIKLCEAQNLTRVGHLTRFLWNKIIVSETENSEAKHLTVNPGCFSFRWTPCSKFNYFTIIFYQHFLNMICVLDC